MVLALIQPISASLVVRPVDSLPMANAFLLVLQTHSLPIRPLAEHVTATVLLVQALNSTNARHVRPIDRYSRMADVCPHVLKGNFSTRLRVVAQAVTATAKLVPHRVLTSA